MDHMSTFGQVYEHPRTQPRRPLPAVRQYRGNVVPWVAHDCDETNACSFCRSQKREFVKQAKANIVYNEPGNEPWAGKAKLLNLNNPIYEDNSHEFECEDGTLGAFPTESVISSAQEYEKLVEWLHSYIKDKLKLPYTSDADAGSSYDNALLSCTTDIQEKLKELDMWREEI